MRESPRREGESPRREGAALRNSGGLGRLGFLDGRRTAVRQANRGGGCRPEGWCRWCVLLGALPAPSGRGRNVLDVLTDNPRMPSGDAQQGDRGTLWMPPTLLPVSEGVNADAHGLSELYLGEPDKTP